MACLLTGWKTFLGSCIILLGEFYRVLFLWTFPENSSSEFSSFSYIAFRANICPACFRNFELSISSAPHKLYPLLNWSFPLNENVLRDTRQNRITLSCGQDRLTPWLVTTRLLWDKKVGAGNDGKESENRKRSLLSSIPSSFEFCNLLQRDHWEVVRLTL